MTTRDLASLVDHPRPLWGVNPSGRLVYVRHPRLGRIEESRGYLVRAWVVGADGVEYQIYGPATVAVEVRS